MDVKIKPLYKNTVLPYYATEDAVGMDCTVHSKVIDLDNSLVHYGLGFAIEIPKGHAGLLFPRSSIYKHQLSLSNSVGVIDPDYRGEVGAKFYTSDDDYYEIGERCCQLIIIEAPNINLIVTNKLSETTRNTGGYGSTGQ